MFEKSLLLVLLASLVNAEVILECKDNGNALQPYPGDCTKFYGCAPQGIEVYVCPEGLHFNHGYMVCDYPEFARCTQEVRTEGTTALSEGTVAPPEPETTPSEEADTAPDESETEEFDCPIDADISFRPHPANCNQFYQCYAGESHIFTCQEGLHFNPAVQVCDYPENVGCVGGTAPPNVPTIPEPLPQTTPELQPDTTPEPLPQTTAELQPDTTPEPLPQTTPQPQPETTPGETEQFDCPIDADLSFHPHPTNCNQFYQCYGGESHTFTCQEGLHFNPAEQVCDYPENVGCVGGTAPPKAPTTQEPETTSEPLPQTTPQPQPETTPGETEQFDCPIDADLSFRPHPTNCNQFYQCYGGESYTLTCQEGLHFNPVEQVCDYPENVGCVGGTANPASSTSTTVAPPADGGASGPFECRLDSDQLYHSIPAHCNQFYQCYEGHVYTFNCQFGLQFSYEAQACDYPENVGCA